MQQPWVFPQRFRQAREEAGLTQGDVAERMREAGHDQFVVTTVSRLEKGKRDVSLRESLVLAEIVGEALESLVEGDALTGPVWDTLLGSVRQFRKKVHQLSEAERRVRQAREEEEGSSRLALLALRPAMADLAEALSRHRDGRGEYPRVARLQLAREALGLFRETDRTQVLDEVAREWPEALQVLSR